MKNSLLCLPIVLSLTVASCGRRVGKVLETYEHAAATFRLRVTAREELSQRLSGGLYRYECKLQGTNAWVEILSFRHDDPIKIPTTQIRDVDARVSYFFIGWTCATTSDGGASWHVWDAKKDLPGWQPANYGLIKSLQLSGNGKGVMVLKPIGNRTKGVTHLQTDDYGKTWTAKKTLEPGVPLDADKPSQ